jgi:hypothetical protein
MAPEAAFLRPGVMGNVIRWWEQPKSELKIE